MALKRYVPAIGRDHGEDYTTLVARADGEAVLHADVQARDAELAKRLRELRDEYALADGDLSTRMSAIADEIEQGGNAVDQLAPQRSVEERARELLAELLHDSKSAGEVHLYVDDEQSLGRLAAALARMEGR